MNYTQIFKDNFNIPNVYFDIKDENIIKEMLIAFDRVYNKYPALLGCICAFGNDISIAYNSVSSYCKHNNIELTSELLKQGLEEIKPGVFSTICYYDKRLFNDYVYYIGLRYSKLFGYTTKPLDSRDIKYCIYHEFGHILDYILSLKKSYHIKKIILSNDDITDYVHSNSDYFKLKESIAEAFAISMYNYNSNRVASEIFDIINQKYKKKENSNAFNIKGRV